MKAVHMGFLSFFPAVLPSFRPIFGSISRRTHDGHASRIGSSNFIHRGGTGRIEEELQEMRP